MDFVEGLKIKICTSKVRSVTKICIKITFSNKIFSSKVRSVTFLFQIIAHKSFLYTFATQKKHFIHILTHPTA